MSQYNIAEAKAQLSELTRRALAGEEIIATRASGLRQVSDRAGPG